MSFIYSYVIIFANIIYFLVLLFNGKSFRYKYLIHTLFVFAITAAMFVDNWDINPDDFQILKASPLLLFLHTLLMIAISLYIILDNRRNSYTQVLKKEIWGEWANHKDK